MKKSFPQKKEVLRKALMDSLGRWRLERSLENASSVMFWAGLLGYVAPEVLDVSI